MAYLTRSLLSLFAVQVAASSWTSYPSSGPLLPRPAHLHGSSIPQTAIPSFEETLIKVLNGSISPGFSVANTSFSLGLVSLDSLEPIWQFHHRGSANVNGTNIVDGESQYLVGSISKLITDLLVLRTGIDLDTPLTQYLPKLANETSVIKWENITLASLADHLSGIPPNYDFSEFYYLQPLLEQLGFPALEDGDYAECGISGLNGPCSQERMSHHSITSTLF